MKPDLIRYFILWKIGGLFADIDIEALQPIDTLLTGKTMSGSRTLKALISEVAIISDGSFSVGCVSDVRRTVVGGARVVSGAEKKNHLIEVAPFGRLDQMPRATERRRKKSI